MDNYVTAWGRVYRGTVIRQHLYAQPPCQWQTWLDGTSSAPRVRHPVSFHSDVVEWRGLAGAVWRERIAGFCQSSHLKSSMLWLPHIW